MSIQITQLRVYPVKSLGVQESQKWLIDKRGLQFDRRWMVVDPQGTFITQRNTPRMSHCHPRFFGDHWDLTCEGLAQLRLPEPQTGGPISVRVWGDEEITAELCGPEADAWITGALCVPARLVYLPDKTHRPIDPPYGREGEIAGFTDNHPILVVGEESLADLNERLEISVPIQRFRPNIVIKGAPAFAEDTWKQIQIGPVTLRATMPCARCSFTTLDHETGITTGSEPLRTLATYRRSGTDVRFGMYYVPEVGGQISVGDEVTVS